MKSILIVLILAMVLVACTAIMRVKAEDVQIPYRVLEVERYELKRFVDPDNGNVCYLGEREGYAIYSISCVKAN